MKAVAILLLLSVCVALAAIYTQGPELSGLLLFAALLAASGVLLSVFAAFRRPRAYIVVDGSNVMHWDGETPALGTVKEVVRDLQGRGFTPVIWFDANVGYLVGERYMGPDRLSERIGIPARQVFVAPKGTPADPLLLEGAERLGARVVTNDRFRDWHEEHPKVLEPGFLVRGQFKDGQPALDLAF